MTRVRQLGAATLIVSIIGTSEGAGIRITEWLYSGSRGEFIELTNTSDSAIDLTGWSYDDSRTPRGSI